jgi:uncharacterized protein (TIGR02145 family)
MKQSYHFLFIFFLVCFTTKLYSQSVLITGDLRYDNANLTPLAGVPVHLKTLLGNVVAADTTDSSGSYSMSGFANGNYILDAQIGYNSGGFNSTDALLVNRYFTSLVSLTPLRASASDVNGNQNTNSLDALLISLRSTNLRSSFAVGNYVNDKPTINAQGNPLSVSIRALSTGDVNGSFIVQPSEPILVLDTVYGHGNVGTAVVRFTNPGSGVFERGIVWSSSPNPTISSNRSVAGKGGFGYTHSFSTIDPNNIQYARAYARTSAGVYYSAELSFTPIPGIRCPGTPSVTDIDGNFYYTVQIGTQCWTQSNLKVSKYRNGDNIPTGLNNSAWGSTTIGAYAIYNNDPVNDVLYGKLYNHYAVTDARGLCPTGWHVPTDGEWSTLENFLGGGSVAGGALKSTTGWNNNGNGTNSSGFTALPGGHRSDNGGFGALSFDGYWWSASTASTGNAWYRFLYLHGPHLFRFDGPFVPGYSIRCLRDVVPTISTTTVSYVTATSATTGGDVTQDGGPPVTARGVAYGTSSSPTTSGFITNDGTGTGLFTSNLNGLSPNTNYYVRAYATNALGTAYGNELNFISVFTCGTSPVFDFDGNNYSTVQIGTQCWTQSNLKVSKYRNGDNIATGLSNSVWQNTTAGAYAIYDNNPVNDGLYGKLYNHYAVMDTRGLCPTGWHVPTDGEWTTLVTFLGGLSGVAGGALKSTTTQPTPGGWNSPNSDATNSSGFTAGPGGLRNASGDFNYVGSSGFWWSSSLSGPSAWNRYLVYYGGAIYRSSFNYFRTHGFSVRCLRD